MFLPTMQNEYIEEWPIPSYTIINKSMESFSASTISITFHQADFKHKNVMPFRKQHLQLRPMSQPVIQPSKQLIHIPNV